MAILESAAIYIANKILDNTLDEFIFNKLWHKHTYRKRLIRIIYEVIDTFEKKFPPKKFESKSPFYHSQILFEELLKLTLFKSKVTETLQIDFANFPNFIAPTESELNEFLELLVDKIKKDIKLKTLFINENYKEEIFSISRSIPTIITTLDNIEATAKKISAITEKQVKSFEEKTLTPEKVLAALGEQGKKQLEKQVRTEKYISGTFIEISTEKDLLRYFCNPDFFIKKEFAEIKNLDFRRLNLKLEKDGKKEFKLNFDVFESQIEKSTVSNYIEIISILKKYLDEKDIELKSFRTSHIDDCSFKTKLTEKIEVLSFFTRKLFLITETAGQGKTNFVCDFAANFLLKKNIPFTFLTGYEIDSSNVHKSISARVFPFSSEYHFDEILNQIKIHCALHNCHYVIIIDGINENPNVKDFALNLESFLTDVQKYDFVKVILTCRSEYFDYNFGNLKSFISSGEMGLIQSLNHRLSDIAKKKLFETYLSYFNVQISYMNDKAKKQLVDNFILLRIFCETYKDQNNLEFDNIYKEELFEKYFELKCNQINKKINENDEYGLKGSFDTKEFLLNITEYMVLNEQFSSIPLDKIIKDPNNRQMCIRFLDENILVKRDIRPQSKEIFEDKEVVNFTFDEFRDFSISSYLIQHLYKSSKDKFTKFLENNLTNYSAITEGCRTFLFFIARKAIDSDLQKIVQSQKWYKTAFVRGVFSLRDSEITSDDLNYLAHLYCNAEGESRYISRMLAYRRYDTDRFKTLNILFLFNILNQLSEMQHKQLFYSAFEIHTTYMKSEFDKLIDRFEEILENNEFQEYPPFHNLFHLLIYFFPVDEWRTAYLYERYCSQFPKESKEQLNLTIKGNNKKLVSIIKSFIKQYEITI